MVLFCLAYAEWYFLFSLLFYCLVVWSEFICCGGNRWRLLVVCAVAVPGQLGGHPRATALHPVPRPVHPLEAGSHAHVRNVTDDLVIKGRRLVSFPGPSGDYGVACSVIRLVLDLAGGLAGKLWNGIVARAPLQFLLFVQTRNVLASRQYTHVCRVREWLDYSRSLRALMDRCSTTWQENKP